MSAPRTAADIGYLSDCDAEYAKGLKAVERNRQELAAFVAEWQYLAGDAVRALPAQKGAWQRWLAGLSAARDSRRAIKEQWVRDFGAILLPRLLLEVTIVAHHFVTPWGCAFIRCREMGLIQDRDGQAVWTAAP